MRNVTLTEKQFKALLAAGIDLSAQLDEAPKKAKKAKKAPKKVQAAKKACYQKRIARFEGTDLGGVTKVDNRALAAELRLELGREFTAKEWKKAKRELKAELTRLNCR